MKKIAKLPTVLGLIILFIGLISGIFLINSRSIFKLGAQVDTNPKNVRISNTTNSSITVSWTTDIPSVGFVKWGASQTNINKVAQDNIDEKNTTHWVTILGINPNEQIYFKINSDGQDWDNNDIPWQAKTSNKNEDNLQPLNTSGAVVNPDGSPSQKTLVYISVSGTLLSTTTSSNGNWLIPLANYITVDPKSAILEISVVSGDNNTSSAIIYAEVAKNTPLMVLGKSYDFRTMKATNSDNLPESELSIPDAVSASSRFEVGDSLNTSTTTVTLDSIDENEIITTIDPEFFGTGPINTEIEIIVESEMQTTILSPNSQGRWSWSPPSNLEPGEHSVTVKWKDENGILRTITRSFVVAAAEGPAFVSTPSATPIQTQEPISTSTPTNTPSETPQTAVVTTSSPTITASTPTSSSSPELPESGVLTPTLGLFIMGIGILMSSFFVYKTANG